MAAKKTTATKTKAPEPEAEVTPVVAADPAPCVLCGAESTDLKDGVCLSCRA